MASQEPMAGKSAASIFRVQGWRVTLVAALIGLLIVLAMLMKWIVEFQVEAARERRLSEAVAREAVARCHEKVPLQAVNACLGELAAARALQSNR
ncbi:general secretion pathway protein GspL [Variovorax paradoxus]|uniref:general secretion pathway protein GspL n=1 Tax=Variovorax paradoxus TaxID=34073 RepID=UPI0021AC1F08|nr:general secretion pathway protein GspL [Variovorax paradoxus]UVH60400.1 general secretion pathway protein GspL [Variovorax paradoxus]